MMSELIQELSILQEFGIVGTGLAIFISINAFFYKVDDFFSKRCRKDVYLWLLRIDTENKKSSWSKYFIQLFDRLFKASSGHNPDNNFKWNEFFSLHTFRRSCIASIGAFSIVFLVGITVGHITDLGVKQSLGNHPLFFVLVFVSVNLLPDYLSLIQTRFLLSLINKKSTKKRLILFLIIDLIITFLVFFILGIPLFLLMLVLSGDQQFSEFSKFFDMLLKMWCEFLENLPAILWLKKDVENNISGVFLFSTFFTSVWIWLFGISNILIKLSVKYKRFLCVIKRILPIKEKPFRSIGTVSGVVAACLYWVTAIFIVGGFEVFPLDWTHNWHFMHTICLNLKGT